MASLSTAKNNAAAAVNQRNEHGWRLLCQSVVDLCKVVKDLESELAKVKKKVADLEG